MAWREFLLSDTSPSAPGNNDSTAVTQDGLERFDWFTLDAKLTQATGGVLDVYLQRWVASLQEWRDWIHFTQLAAGSTVFRYSLDCRTAATSITTVGQGTSPSISAGVVTVAHPGPKVRLYFVAGASTSAGAVQKVTLAAWKKP
jgi:hypothetical protein